MATLWDLQFESDLSEFDSTVGGSDLSQAAGAALAGTSGGLNIFLDDNTEKYGYKGYTVPSSDNIRFRVYFDPNGMSMGSGNIIRWCQLTNVSNTGYVRVDLTYDGADYGIDVIVRDDSGVNNTIASFTITDAEHYLEVLLTRAFNNNSEDGVCTVWCDGVQKGTSSTLDFAVRFDDCERAWLGMSGFTASERGTMYADEFFANDTGTEIGPISSQSVIPLVMHHRKMMGVS